MVTTNQQKSVARTVGALCVAVGIAYMLFTLLKPVYAFPWGSLVWVLVGAVLLVVSKRRS